MPVVIKKPGYDLHIDTSKAPDQMGYMNIEFPGEKVDPKIVSFDSNIAKLPEPVDALIDALKKGVGAITENLAVGPAQWQKLKDYLTEPVDPLNQPPVFFGVDYDVGVQKPPRKKVGVLKVKKAHVFEKEKNDWYVEDQWVSTRLFQEEDFKTGTNIFDPFCGMGRILDAAYAFGHKTCGHDLVDRGIDKTKHTFHVHDWKHSSIGLWKGSVHVVSNPPYDQVNHLFGDMHQHGIAHKTALFLPMQYLGGKAKWLAQLPLSHVWVCTPRPNCLPGHLIQAGMKPGGGFKDFGWYVFDPECYQDGAQTNPTGYPHIRWLAKNPADQIKFDTAPVPGIITL